MNEFKPKYRKALWIGLIFFPICLIFLGPQVFEDPGKDPKLTLSWFGVFIMTSLLPVIFIRRIKFEERWFIVEKYIGTTSKIFYEDVIDVGATLLKHRGGKVNLHSITNVDEFINVLSDKIDLNEMEGEIYKGEVNNFITAVWATIPILLVPICVYFLPISSKWKPLITLPLILVIVFIIGKIVEIRNNKMLENLQSENESHPP